MNKSIIALKAFLPVAATKPEPKPEPTKAAPRVLTEVERQFIVLVAMHENGLIPESVVIGPTSKTCLTLKSWRPGHVVNLLMGTEGHYSNGRGGKGPKRWVEAKEGTSLSGYYLNYATDHVTHYARYLQTPVAKAAMLKILAA